MIKWRWVSPPNRDEFCLYILKYVNDEAFQLTQDGWKVYGPGQELDNPYIRISGMVIAELMKDETPSPFIGMIQRDTWTPILDYSKEEERIVYRLQQLAVEYNIPVAVVLSGAEGVAE